MSEKQSEKYLGFKSATVACVDGVRDGKISGEFFHKYSKEGIPFTNLAEMILRMDDFFNEINYPVSGTNLRSFANVKVVYRREPLPVVNEDEQILNKKGTLGTYIIRVQQRQNSTWQGKITWVEKDETVSFRSALEMIRLIESSLQTK